MPTSSNHRYRYISHGRFNCFGGPGSAISGPVGSRTYKCLPYLPITLPLPASPALSQHKTDTLSVLLRRALEVLMHYVPEGERENMLRAFPLPPSNSVPFIPPRNRDVEKLTESLLHAFPLTIFKPLKKAVLKGEGMGDVEEAIVKFKEAQLWVKQWIDGGENDWRVRRMAYVIEQVLAAEKHSLAALHFVGVPGNMKRGYFSIWGK